MNDSPNLVIISGPNGAGKSTAAPFLLKEFLDLEEFVNADVIAQGLSAYAPEKVAISAGRIMLRRIHELAEQRASFAFETTLASRSFIPWIAGLRKTAGYDFHLMYLWVPSPEFSIARVEDRVRHGGHNVPEEVIRRRYHTGLRNFFHGYLPLTTSWGLYDNSIRRGEPRLVAFGHGRLVEIVSDRDLWDRLRREQDDDN